MGPQLFARGPHWIGTRQTGLETMLEYGASWPLVGWGRFLPPPLVDLW